MAEQLRNGNRFSLAHVFREERRCRVPPPLAPWRRTRHTDKARLVGPEYAYSRRSSVSGERSDLHSEFGVLHRARVPRPKHRCTRRTDGRRSGRRPNESSLLQRAANQRSTDSRRCCARASEADSLPALPSRAREPGLQTWSRSTATNRAMSRWMTQCSPGLPVPICQEVASN